MSENTIPLTFRYYRDAQRFICADCAEGVTYRRFNRGAWFNCNTGRVVDNAVIMNGLEDGFNAWQSENAQTPRPARNGHRRYDGPTLAQWGVRKARESRSGRDE